MIRLLSTTLWAELRVLSASQRPIIAAVAYVSSDENVAFGSGDILITDATDDSVAAGQTRAIVLQAALSRGATLFSCSNLHAKVMVFGSTAVIGSSNISAHSAAVLTEAAWLTSQSQAVAEARTFIQGLIQHSVLIDEAFIARILEIPVRPRPRGAVQGPTVNRSDSIVVFFKQVLRGDLRKFRHVSATTHTGGGARDLRVSPANVFRAPLQQIIPHPGPRLDVTQGEVYWLTEAGASHATVELWSPTRQRPGELRIARWWAVDGWNVSDEAFEAESSAGRRMFYILELDLGGMAWARVLREADLHSETRIVADHIRNRTGQTNSRSAVVGLVDLSTGHTLPD